MVCQGFLDIKNAASYKTMRQIGGPRGIRTLDLSDANRTLSQLSYRPIFVFRNENSVTLLERFVKDFSPGRPAGNGRVDRTRRFLETADPFVKITVAFGEKACYNNAETSAHKKSITQSQEDNGYGIY